VHDRLHLHRLEHDHRGARLDYVADADRSGDNQRRGRAPMVTKATYAVIGDLHEILPAISEEIRRRKG
jgi:hypothetical protein